jgi:hypothetical protein
MESKRAIVSILLTAFFMLQPAMDSRAREAQSQAAREESSHAAEIEQAVRAAASDSILEVTLLDGQKLHGRLKSVGEEDFVLEPIDNQFSGDRAVRFDAVKSLEIQKPMPASAANKQRSKLSKRGKIMLFVGVAALIFGVVTYATTKGP